MRGADRQPRVDARKARMTFARRPRQRRPRTVARQGERPVLERLGILSHFERNLDLIEPELIAIINVDIAAKRAEKRHLPPRIGGGLDAFGGPARQRARRAVIFVRPDWTADPRRIGPSIERN